MGPRPPMLLLLTSAGPRRDLAAGMELPETPVEGIRFLSRPVLGDILLIESRRLPRGRRGYSVPRLMPTPRGGKDAVNQIRELVDVLAVLDSTKDALMTDVTSKWIPSSPQEERSILDIEREKVWRQVEERIAHAETRAAREALARKKVEEHIAHAETRAAREALARKKVEERIAHAETRAARETLAQKEAEERSAREAIARESEALARTAGARNPLRSKRRPVVRSSSLRSRPFCPDLTFSPRKQAVPRATCFIDAVVTVSGPVDGLRPILPLILGRTVIIEHYHQELGIPDWCRAIKKLGHLVDEHWRDLQGDAESLCAAVAQASEWAELTHLWHRAALHGRELEVALPDRSVMGPRPPMLLLITSAQPRRDLAAGMELPETPVEGIRFLSRPVLGDILLIESRRLPRGRRGYSVLRLIPTPRSGKDAVNRIRELVDDLAVLDSTKDALMTDLASNRIPSTPQEKRSILDTVREEVWRQADERIAHAETRAAREALARKEAEERLHALEEELAALRVARDESEA